MIIRHKTLLCVLLLLIAVPAVPNAAGRAAPGESATSKHKKKELTATGGRAVLWKQPRNIESLDLFYGPGGPEDAPDLSGTFRYIRPDTKGTQKKIVVKDGKGEEWIVKFGPEARPETASTRIVWAMGYHTDEDYFVKRVHIDGLKDDAVNVRFKRHHDGYKNIGNWTWESNPFVGTRELDGLKVLMLVLNNWDLKTNNNKILEPKKNGQQRGRSSERIYYVGDLGATFGKTGSLARELHFPNDPPAGSKDKPNQYARQSFVDGVTAGEVRFHYKGKDPSAVRQIRVAHVRWMGGMLARLSDKQLGDAFRASGYDQAEIGTLVGAMRQRIAELQGVR